MPCDCGYTVQLYAASCTFTANTVQIHRIKRSIHNITFISISVHPTTVWDIYMHMLFALRKSDRGREGGRDSDRFDRGTH